MKMLKSINDHKMSWKKNKRKLIIIIIIVII